MQTAKTPHAFSLSSDATSTPPRADRPGHASGPAASAQPLRSGRLIDPQIENAFTYHSPQAHQSERYELLRGEAKKLAYLITVSCPASREQSLALTNLEQAVMWANASISRNE